jgi:hypothetical protein
MFGKCSKLHFYVLSLEKEKEKEFIFLKWVAPLLSGLAAQAGPACTARPLPRSPACPRTPCAMWRNTIGGDGWPPSL